MNSADCCAAFTKARDTGTDAEGYGREITLVDAGYPPDKYPPHYAIGTDLPPIGFCPWCGSHIALSKDDGMVEASVF